MKLKRCSVACPGRTPRASRSRSSSWASSPCSSGGAGRAGSAIGDAFTVVRWEWVAVAVGAQPRFGRRARDRLAHGDPSGDAAAASRQPARLLGVLRRALRERRPAGPDRRARARRRARRASCRRRKGLWATLVGTVFAHRVFDLVPVVLLILYVVVTAKIPAWAITSLVALRRRRLAALHLRVRQRAAAAHAKLDHVGGVRRIVTMARQGLGVMRSPVGTTIAILFQIAGLDVPAPRRLGGDARVPHSLAAAGRRRRAAADERRDGVPALARQRRTHADRDRDAAHSSYGIAYAQGVAYGFGLQAIEASVGIGVGLLFLAREGLSFAMLQVMPSADQAEMRDQEADARKSRMPRPRALACPASLKGVLSARAAAAALADGFAQAASSARSCRSQTAARERSTRSAAQRDGATVVEAAQTIPFDPARLDVMAASSRAFGELLAGLDAERLLVGLGGTATMDAGAGLLEVLDALPAPTTVLCDVQTPLYDAPRLFGPQKGATPEQVAELERRFRSSLGSRRSPRCPAPAPRAASAPRSPRSAQSSCPARRRSSTCSASTRALRPRRDGGGARRRDDRRRQGAGGGRAALRSAGVPCVVFGGVVDRAARGRRDGRALGRSARARRRISSS